jgi:23S rRNA (pseudouridine1915-N3)-methyltransferase
LALLKSHEQLAKNLSSKSHAVLITPNGTSLTSEDFADQINTWGISGISEIAFIIGASDFESNSTLALTSMEMDSGLSATVVFEQIYRAYRILNNQPYHK